MFEILNDGSKTVTGNAKIRVIGVGGGGGNAVNTMIKAGLKGVEYIVANTDAQALNASLAPIKIQLGAEITKGLGAGANPEVGRQAALEEYEKLSQVLVGADMVFITAGMGGGTGTGAAPVIAKLAKELGALTVGICTKPFQFEGKKRIKQAETGINNLEECVDSLILIPNQRLLHIAGEKLSLVDTFKCADEVLLNAVQGISDLINNTGLINADFADVSTVMANKGRALMGTGMATGNDRALKAAKEAISSPLLEDISIDGATGIIINITGDENLTTFETNQAVSLIMEAADENAEIIFGTVIDASMKDHLKVTVIATGLGEYVMKREAAADRLVVAQTTSAAAPAPSISPAAAATAYALNPSSSVAAASSVPSSALSAATVAGFATTPTTATNTPVSERSTRVPQFQHIIDHRPHTTQVTPNPVINNVMGVNTTEDVAASMKQQSQSSNIVGNSNNNDSAKVMGRAKSIAERLGFINFDEDEFDTPTYLRKDNGRSKEKDQFLD